MAQGRVIVLNETSIGKENEWKLCFQYCRYEYGDAENSEDNGYRFIWRRPEGSLQGARGQARIPSISDIQCLTGKALAEGWGHYNNGSLGFKY